MAANKGVLRRLGNEEEYKFVGHPDVGDQVWVEFGGANIKISRGNGQTYVDIWDATDRLADAPRGTLMITDVELKEGG